MAGQLRSKHYSYLLGHVEAIAIFINEWPLDYHYAYGRYPDVTGMLCQFSSEITALQWRMCIYWLRTKKILLLTPDIFHSKVYTSSGSILRSIIHFHIDLSAMASHFQNRLHSKKKYWLIGHQNEGKVLIVKIELSKSLCFAVIYYM